MIKLKNCISFSMKVDIKVDIKFLVLFRLYFTKLMKNNIRLCTSEEFLEMT